ncbi:YrdB family protein [Kitasatospora sp. NPDC059571]|uniref:YrdB family protein n=1 Tax=Kitasatospora sp. NPDC059571 TaxID=3346871 RepID=UPI0036981F9A
MIHSVRTADDTLAFALELAVYAAVAAYGLTRRGLPRWGRWPAALALVAGWAGLWAVFGAPGAAVPLHGAARAALDLLWFGSAAAALVAMGRRRPAVVFAALYVLTTAVHLAL